MVRRILGAAAIVTAAFMSVPVQGARLNFIPDYTFKGNTLTGWKVVGQATWKAVNGELIGTPTSADGGWLVLDHGLQDFQFGADLKCVAACKAGVLVRAEVQPDGSMKGIFIPYGEGETGLFNVTVDATGKITQRDAVTGGGVGNMVRYAPPPPDPNAPAPARGGGRGRGGAAAAGAAGAPGAGAQAPAGAPGGGAAAAAGGRGFGGRGAGAAGAPGALPGGGRGRGAVWQANDWNDIGIIADVNTMRKLMSGQVSGSQAVPMNGFGPIALYVGGAGEAHYRDVSYQDVGLKRFPKEVTSTNFTERRLNPFFYAFSIAVADMNHDNIPDVVSGPFIYYGPDYTTGREFYAAQALNPSIDFPQTPQRDEPAPRGDGNWVAFAGDFTGDGWGDVLLANTSGSALYVNPGKDGARRWDVYRDVIPPGRTQAEINTMADIDGDGKLDLVYNANPMGAPAGAITGVMWAHPDPKNPTGMWIGTNVGGNGTYAAHGIGSGDVNGDHRVDILTSSGWWEQPASGPMTPNWTFHAGPFGSGGAEMDVYDINGDGLNDVITSRQAHNFGLNWYEQKKDKATGEITFEEHQIFKDYSTQDTNAGHVAFSELHGSTMGDINGDGIPDFIVGKRKFSHHESFLDLDPYGPPVLYAYITVRDKSAPGGARFEPELINNASGAGSQVAVADLNKDGVNDVITGGVEGTFIFFGKPRPGMKTTAAAAKTSTNAAAPSAAAAAPKTAPKTAPAKK